MKVGPITCTVCHANWLICGFKIRSTFISIQLFQLRLSPSKAEKSNTSPKSLLGVTIKNTRTEQNLVSRDTSCDLYS